MAAAGRESSISSPVQRRRGLPGGILHRLDAVIDGDFAPRHLVQEQLGRYVGLLVNSAALAIFPPISICRTIEAGHAVVRIIDVMPVAVSV